MSNLRKPQDCVGERVTPMRGVEGTLQYTPEDKTFHFIEIWSAAWTRTPGYFLGGDFVRFNNYQAKEWEIDGEGRMVSI